MTKFVTKSPASQVVITVSPNNGGDGVHFMATNPATGEASVFLYLNGKGELIRTHVPPKRAESLGLKTNDGVVVLQGEKIPPQPLTDEVYRLQGIIAQQALELTQTRNELTSQRHLLRRVKTFFGIGLNRKDFNDLENDVAKSVLFGFVP